jgi:hypothetical protein
LSRNIEGATAAADGATNGGILIVNVVARSEQLFQEALRTLGGVFPTVLQMDVEDDVNRVLVGVTASAPLAPVRELIASATRLQVAAGRAWGEVRRICRAGVGGDDSMQAMISRGLGSRWDSPTCAQFLRADSLRTHPQRVRLLPSRLGRACS